MPLAETDERYRVTIRQGGVVLRSADVGHGDLQHGNIMLVPVPEKNAHALRLIDYDGMYVPSLADKPPG